MAARKRAEDGNGASLHLSTVSLPDLRTESQLPRAINCVMQRLLSAASGPLNLNAQQLTITPWEGLVKRLHQEVPEIVEVLAPPTLVAGLAFLPELETGAPFRLAR